MEFKFNNDTTLYPKQEPEVVALGGQKLEDVKKILKEAHKDECERQEELAKDITDLFNDDGVKLTYESELSTWGVPKLCEARSHCRFEKNVDDFAEWRKLADVRVRVSDKFLSEADELMNCILNKSSKCFPKLKLKWSEESWNPRLLIDSSSTNITMEKLALAYQGLINITNELKAKEIIADAVVNKLKELFI